MKQRQVSIELLRVLAMLMVLTLHANFIGIEKPNVNTIMTDDGVARAIIQSLCICAVNTFVMISGWFGIHPSVRGFANFMWQVCYFVGLSYLAFFIFNGNPISYKNILSCIGLYDGGGWFVSAYIGLYILSPILNSFIKTARSKSIMLFLVAFFIFEFLWGNTLSVGFIIGGYSTFSFIGIYILAGLLRKVNYRIKPKFAVLLYLLTCILNGVLYIISVRLGYEAVASILLNYINPLVIASAAFLLLAFVNMSDPKRLWLRSLILWLGASCFAAYLLHVGTSLSSTLYLDSINLIHSGHSWYYGLVLVFLFILAVFVFAVLLDQPRKLIWKYILSPFFIDNKK